MNTNVMFFKPNKVDETATYTIDPYIGLSDYLYDRLQAPVLSSDGYDDDTTTWQIVIDFVSPVTFDIVILDGLNATGLLEAFVGGVWTTVSTISTATTTFFEKKSSPITTNSVRLSLTDTDQNAEKTISEFILASFIGQLEKNPSRVESLLSESSRTHITATGSVVYVRMGQAFKSKMMLNGASNTDIALIKSLKNMVDPFILYLCGGVDNAELGFGLGDYYLVNYINNYEPKLRNQILGIGQDITVEMHEV